MKKRLADCAVWEQWGFYLVIEMAAAAYLSTGAVSVGIAASSLVFLGQRYFTGRWPYIDKKIASAIGIYIAVNYLIAALSIAPSVSLRQVGSDVYRFFPFFFAAAYVRTRKQLWQVLLAFGISVFVNNLVALSQFFGGLQNADVQAGKTWMHIHGLISSSTFFSSLLLLSLPVSCLGFTRREFPRYGRFFFAGLFAFSCILLILCRSRGGWVAFAGTLFIAFFMDARLRNVCLKMAAVIACVFAVLATVVYPSFMLRLSSIMDTTKNPSNLQRIWMWQASVDIWKDHPMHGTGQDTFGLVYTKDSKYMRPKAIPFGNPHSNFFKALSETGIVGVLASLGLHAFFVYRLWRLHRLQCGNVLMTFGAAGILMLMAIVLGGLTDTTMNQHKIMRTYWLLLGIMFAGTHIVTEQDTSERDGLC
ncbi:MAG: O-antigen ligase family protein [Schwartzia succinivorans]|nr:O-antigen ligase family protein [Schwartzia succinivorans]